MIQCRLLLLYDVFTILYGISFVLPGSFLFPYIELPPTKLRLAIPYPILLTAMLSILLLQKQIPHRSKYRIWSNLGAQSVAMMRGKWQDIFLTLIHSFSAEHRLLVAPFSS